MTRLLEQVERNIVDRGLLRDGQSVLVAVSGGVDSIVLLHVLKTLAVSHRWKLSIAHFNHLLRGAESNADERLVRDAAKRLGLPVVVEKWTDKKRKQLIKANGLEMAARLARHAFWSRAARRLGIDALATAHHADDQVELFFIRLFRGSGSDGLGGMKWSAEGVLTGTRIIRPLLDQTKDSLAAYAAAQKIPFREDSSNFKPEFTRNRIRHHLIPALATEYEPAILKTVLRSMDIISAESDYARAEAERWLSHGKRPSFDRLHPAIQRQCILRQLVKLSISADFQVVEHLRLNPGTQLTISPGWFVTRNSDGQVHKNRLLTAGFNTGKTSIDVSRFPGRIVFSGLALTWNRLPVIEADLANRSKDRPEYFDSAKIGAEVTLRHWRKGDRFQPIGMSEPVKLQDLFTNLKIPTSTRREMVLGVSSDGTIFWVEGLRISEQFKVTSGTTDVLRWEWTRKWGAQPEIANGAPA